MNVLFPLVFLCSCDEVLFILTTLSLWTKLDFDFQRFYADSLLFLSAGQLHWTLFYFFYFILFFFTDLFSVLFFVLTRWSD